jgi:hypothetical protein
VPTRLDAIDRQILRELQADGRMTNVELARRLGMSAPPCLRRVRALEEAGIITGYRALVDEKALGFDVVVFASPLLRVGRWRCPADHPHFLDSGPSSDALFVFPRQSVWIQHDGGRPFVADPNTVTYYNKGQRYRRQQLSEAGDHGFALGALFGQMSLCDRAGGLK